MAIFHIICNISDFLTPWGLLYSRASCFRMTIPLTVFVTNGAGIVDWNVEDFYSMNELGKTKLQGA